jgi:hypothetical protein
MKYSDYYLWLDSLVNDGNHELLIRYLHSQPYRWQFTLDENRAAGGINLRSEYAWNTSTEVEDVREGPCTVLEMLVGVASHMEDQLEISTSDCFWMLIENLGLDKYEDDDYNPREVECIIDSWLNHNYKSNGVGSIFPLKRYQGDCRNLDIWSQMNAWISENYPADESWLN